MAKFEPEKVGRKYTAEYFRLSHRMVKDGGKDWYGPGSYKTQEEAQKAINKVGQRYVDVGFILDLGPATDLCEYRIVKVVAQCEVVHTEIKKI